MAFKVKNCNEVMKWLLIGLGLYVFYKLFLENRKKSTMSFKSMEAPAEEGEELTAEEKAELDAMAQEQSAPAPMKPLRAHGAQNNPQVAQSFDEIKHKSLSRYLHGRTNGAAAQQGQFITDLMRGPMQLGSGHGTGAKPTHIN